MTGYQESKRWFDLFNYSQSPTCLGTIRQIIVLQCYCRSLAYCTCLSPRRRLCVEDHSIILRTPKIEKHWLMCNGISSIHMFVEGGANRLLNETKRGRVSEYLQ